MPNMMESMASGSQAALQMQQNYAAGPYVQQEAAARAKKQQLDIEQEQGNIEKTRLNNMATVTGFKADEESKAALQKIMGTKEWQAGDDSARMRLAGSALMLSNNVEAGSKALIGAELLDARKIATDAKTHALNDEQVTKAHAAINVLDPKDVPAFFERLPDEIKKSVVSQVGQKNWDSYDGVQKKEVVKSLMMNTKGQIASQLKDMDQTKLEFLRASVERIADNTDRRIREFKNGGSDGKADREERLSFQSYTRASRDIERDASKQGVELQKAVDAAQLSFDKTYFFDKTEGDKLKKAITARDNFTRKTLQRQIKLIESTPNLDDKAGKAYEYRLQLDALDPEPEEKVKGGSPTPGKGEASPTGAEAKSDKGAPSKPPSGAPADAQLAPDKHWYTKNKEGKYVDWGPSTTETAKPKAEAAPAALAAASSVGKAIGTAADEAYAKYLQQKLNKGTATAGEKEKARRLGITKE